MADGRLLLQIRTHLLSSRSRPGSRRTGRSDAVLSDGAVRSSTSAADWHLGAGRNHPHPRLLSELAEECRAASARQLLVTTHSPFFVNGLRTEELSVLYRDERGYTQERVGDMIGVPEFMDEGPCLATCGWKYV